MNTEQIQQVLRSVRDPHSGQDIVSADMVRDLRIEGENVLFTLEISALQAKNKDELNFACIGAIQDYFPQANVNVHFVASANINNPTPFSNFKHIIAVASGKGGVGKSTVAVNLALGLQKLGAKVGLMDADVYGPSIPTMLGLQGKRPMIKDTPTGSKMVPLEAYGIQVISIGNIIEPEQAVVLRGPRLAAIIKQFFQEVIWQPLDYMVIDLPPGTGDVQLTLVQTAKVNGVVLVTTPQEVALADAIKAMNMFLLPQINVPIIGVVENMSWFTPAELPDNQYFIFGKGGGQKLATLSGSKLLGQIPLVQSIRESGDKGMPAVLRDEELIAAPFELIAGRVKAAIAERS